MSKILTIISGLFIVTNVYADNLSSTTKATATLNSSCQVSANDVSLGDITPESTAETTGWKSTPTSVGNVAILCNNNVNYSIAMGLGQNVSGTARYLKSDGISDLVPYAICRTNSIATACAATWKISGSELYRGVGSGVIQNIPAYIFLKKGYYPPGVYTDMITVTVSY